jgi:AcrR family transcriptional regulator
MANLQTKVTRADPYAAAVEPRVRHSAEERRQEAVGAVIDLARERSPEGITTQAIADRIGVTHGALFRHFPDKAAIWTAVFDWLGARLGKIADATLAEGGEPLAVLERLFHAQVAFVASHPGVPRILFHELQRPPEATLHKVARRIVGAYRERVKGLIQQAKAAGQLPVCLDADAAAVLFIGTVQGLVVQSTLFSGELDMRDAARRVFPLLLDGFRGAQS